MGRSLRITYSGAHYHVTLAQKIGIYLVHRKSGARLKELGAYFGKKDTAIAQTARRLKLFDAQTGLVRLLATTEKIRLLLLIHRYFSASDFIALSISLLWSSFLLRVLSTLFLISNM